MGHARERSTTLRRHQLLWPGIVFGIGLAGTLDEVILHQLLHWWTQNSIVRQAEVDRLR
jgi:uncharacterized membrane protein